MAAPCSTPEPGFPADPRELGAYLRRGLRRALPSVDDQDIEDFAQEAMVRVIQASAGFRGDSKFSTWAMSIAIRVAFTALRRRREGRVQFDGELADRVGSTAATEEERALDPIFAVLEDSIARCLTDRQRIAIQGELEGVPTELLAERLGIARNALYKLHHDARRKLRLAILSAGYSEAEAREALSGR